MNEQTKEIDGDIEFNPPDKQMPCKRCGEPQSVRYFARGVVCGYCASGNRSRDKQIAALETENEQLKYELAQVDEALANRPALERYTTRVAKICAACREASKYER